MKPVLPTSLPGLSRWKQKPESQSGTNTGGRSGPCECNFFDDEHGKGMCSLISDHCECKLFDDEQGAE